MLVKWKVKEIGKQNFKTPNQKVKKLEDWDS